MEQLETDKEEKKENNQEQEKEPSLGKVPLASRTLDFYFKLIKFPIVFAVVLGGVYFFTTQALDFVWFIDLITIGYVAVVIIKKHQGKTQEIIISCGMTGLIIGFFNALFKLVYYRRFYLFFNLISEPFLTALVGIFVGLAIGFSFFKILEKDKRINKSDSSKEGR